MGGRDSDYVLVVKLYDRDEEFESKGNLKASNCKALAIVLKVNSEKEDGTAQHMRSSRLPHYVRIH